MNKVKKATPKQRKSMSSLARKLSVSRSTLYEWRDAGAPIDRGEAAILEWALAENRKPAESDALRAAKLGVLRETQRRLKIQNDARSREVIAFADAQQQAGRAMGVVFSVLDEMRIQLPPALAGCDAMTIQGRLAGEVERIRAVLKMELEGLAPADANAIALQAESVEIMRMCRNRAWTERCSATWAQFEEWKRQIDADRQAKRAEWCQTRAAEGLPVPDATVEEVARFSVQKG